MGYFLAFLGFVIFAFGGVNLILPLGRLGVKTRTHAFALLIAGAFIFVIGIAVIHDLRTGPVATKRNAPTESSQDVRSAPITVTSRLRDTCLSEPVVADVGDIWTAEKIVIEVRKRMSKKYPAYGAFTQITFDPQTKKWQVITCQATKEVAAAAPSLVSENKEINSVLSRMRQDCPSTTMNLNVEDEETALVYGEEVRKLWSQKYDLDGTMILSSSIKSSGQTPRRELAIACAYKVQAAAPSSIQPSTPPQTSPPKPARLLEFRIAKANGQQLLGDYFYEFDGIVTNAGSESIVDPTITVEIYSKDDALLAQEQSVPAGQFASHMNPGTAAGIQFLLQPKGGRPYCLLMFTGDLELRLKWAVASPLPMCPPYYKRK